MSISYLTTKLLSRFSKKPKEFVSKYFRKKGAEIGENCNILSDISSYEPFLITIGNNTTISTDVTFLTHDASVGNIFGRNNGSDLFGRINIGSNCFIGARSTIMYGVSLADNIIVAAGSVVTRSFMDNNIIIGGNPAKIIGDWEKFESKSKHKVYSVHGKKGKQLKDEILNHQERLVER